MTSASVNDIAGMELAELEGLLANKGIESFRARQVYQWVHKRGVADFAEMSDLSKALRASLAAEFRVSTPAVRDRQRSVDGTEKFVLELADDRRIESVCIPDSAEVLEVGGGPAIAPCQRPGATAGPRHGAEPIGRRASEGVTLCISTQVGCAMGCAFCLTGKMGLVRNLKAGEIVGQVRVLARARSLLDTRFNIVLMGMGEPLHNYEETMKALRMLAEPAGLAMSPRRITLSTVGVAPAIDRLGTEPLMPNLAISLHATTEEQRTRLVPLNRKYNIEEVLAACRRFPVKRRNRITFEYVMLAGVNDSGEDARRLVRLLSGIRAKVNLIPLNEAPGIPFDRPADERVNAFAQVLADHRLTVSVRKSRGRDIRAACGQLIVEGQQKSPGQRLAAAIP